MVKLKGTLETEVYPAEGGFVAIKQPKEMGDEDSIVLLSSDQLPLMIKELQALYDKRAEWQEAALE